MDLGWPSLRLLGSLSVLVLVAVVLKRRYVTSIRDVPGPFLASFSSLWQVWRCWKGDGADEWVRLHRKHGRLPSPSQFFCPGLC